VKVTLESRYDTGDRVRSSPDSEYPFVGVVQEVKFDVFGFAYMVKADNGMYGWLEEYRVYPDSQGK
jgi:hypothetical protein